MSHCWAGEHGSEDCGIRWRRGPTPWHGRRRCQTKLDQTERCLQHPPDQRTDDVWIRPNPDRTQGSRGCQMCRKRISSTKGFKFWCFRIRFRMRPDSLSSPAGFSERSRSKGNAWSVSISSYMGIRNAVNRPSEIHRDFDRLVSRYSFDSNMKGRQKPRKPQNRPRKTRTDTFFTNCLFWKQNSCIKNAFQKWSSIRRFFKKRTKRSAFL